MNDIGGAMYGFFFRTFLVHFDAEWVHRVAFRLLRVVGALPLLVPLLRALYAPRDPRLRVQALGLNFDGPLGLAAGFDKDAVAYGPLSALGFGFIEIGTLTGQPQPGNPRPRLFRLPADRALLNRLGFNNGGSEAAVERMRPDRPAPIGVNIGKTKLVPEEEAAADYVASAGRLARRAHYMVVNVSSPNTPGLRNLQAVEKLAPLLRQVRETLDAESPRRRVPLLVKIAPDLADDDVDAVADMALELGLDGILATNTTLSREGLQTPASRVEALGAGGISGAPVKQRSLRVLRRLRARVGDRLVIIGVGGIETAEDAFERIRAGATLVQAYSGFIYGGPTWPSTLHRQLARLVSQAGFDNIQQAVGVDVSNEASVEP